MAAVALTEARPAATVPAVATAATAEVPAGVPRSTTLRPPRSPRRPSRRRSL